MFKKNIKPILMAGALALATAVSPVLANEDTNHKITINKDFTIDNGNTIINESFGYTVEYKGMYTYDGQDSLDKTTPYPTVYINGSSTTSGSFAFNKGSTGTTTATHKLTGSQTLGFDAGTCIPGVYTYEIYENTINNTDSLKKYTIDSTHYTVYVTVKNNGSGTAIDSVQVRKTNTPNDTKSGSITFENSLHEDKAGNEGDPVFSLTKVVAGDYGDKTKLFEFTGTITLPANTIGTPYTLTGGRNSEGKETDITLHPGEKRNVKFYLRNGDKISSDKLPVGTTYSITETAVSGYTTTIEDDDNLDKDTETADGIIDDTDDLDQITVTNTNDGGGIDTGVIINNMPYIALLGASGAGLVVLAASKKRSKK